MGSDRFTTGILVAALLCLAAGSVTAETYRWKDKDGKTHYGAAVPAEYADQPYDVLNDAGMVIDHIEDTSVPMEIRKQEKEEEKERAPLISQEERDRQYDRLLIIQYSSEDEINEALEHQVGQLEYDKKIFEQSFQSTHKAIRDQIDQAADKQRANQPITETQQRDINRLYARLVTEQKKREVIQQRESRIRARFKRDLERYRFLTAPLDEVNEDATDQG